MVDNNELPDRSLTDFDGIGYTEENFLDSIPNVHNPIKGPNGDAQRRCFSNGINKKHHNYYYYYRRAPILLVAKNESYRAYAT